MTDFEKFYYSRNPLRMTALRDVEKKLQQPLAGYISPSILEEREMHVTQMDVFSRLMMSRQIFFGTEVMDETANVVVAQLLYMDSVNNDDITMYVNSPGGVVYSGYGILDTMAFIKSDVATCCTGLAASMGSMILACGTRGKRSALPLSRVMIHQPLGGARGQATDIEIEAREIMKLKDELCKIISQRSGQDPQKVLADMERDHWLTAAEAKDYGLIDNVVEVKWD